ncbi:Lrp/AsnC family transcriptional regulator [Novosphingobium sp.]|uniref:Lrp/AsnC family transcriptional regulator n=1 Tax=Novosphingobium sp. TaxID=1874826 RepID=UPI003B529E60
MTDRKILAQIQADSSLSHAQLGDLVHLSASQVSRRIARMQADGPIRKQVALLDEQHLGLTVEAYVSVTLTSYSREVVSGFHERVSALPQVLDCCATTGDADYLLRIVTHNLKSLSHLINTALLGHGDVANVRSSIALDVIKRTTALPLEQVPLEQVPS